MKTTLACLFLTLMAYYSLAQAHRSAAHFNTAKGLALDGYDPVSYFTHAGALPGRKDITSAFQGVTYQFRSTENKIAFEKNPQKYLPQFGGWCAYAMGASGEKVEVDPETFKIKNGKLYLFYNRFFNNTLTKWNLNEAFLEAQANKNWDKIITARASENQKTP